MKAFKIFLINIFFLAASATFFAIPWGLKNYPMQMPWNVFFVLASNTSGHDSGTGLSILKGFVIPALILFLLFQLFLFFFFTTKKGKSLNKILSVTGIYFALSIVCLLYSTKAWNYVYIAGTVSAAPQSSDFYDENFISQNQFKIISAEHKKNLIFIFMESMEPGFTDVEHGGFFKENLIPELTSLAEKNISFSETECTGGGKNLQGTSWTVAGMLSKLNAVPFFMPYSKDKNGTKHCLKNSLSLNDVLFSQGYTQIFSMGSEKQFEDRDSLLEDHHVEIHDINWYKKNGMLDPDYQVFWGFEDTKLYALAKQELETLGNGSKPFFYGMLTVDTHFPKGFKCSECKDELKYQMQNVIRCADSQVGDFIKWIQEQDWYKDTTIVICGDHAYLNAPLNNFTVEQGVLSKKEIESKRRFLDIIINPATEVGVEKIKNRKFSSFDIYPTVIELMGNKIEGEGIYLGRSLVSDNKTLCEKYPQKVIEKETMKKIKTYENLK